MLNMIGLMRCGKAQRVHSPFLTEGQAPRLTERCAHKGRELLANPYVSNIVPWHVRFQQQLQMQRLMGGHATACPYTFTIHIT